MSTFLGYAQHSLDLFVDSVETLDKAKELFESEQGGLFSRGVSFLAQKFKSTTAEVHDHPFQIFLSQKDNEARSMITKLHAKAVKAANKFRTSLKVEYTSYCFFEQRLRYSHLLHK